MSIIMICTDITCNINTKNIPNPDPGQEKFFSLSYAVTLLFTTCYKFVQVFFLAFCVTLVYYNKIKIVDIIVIREFDEKVLLRKVASIYV